jgi:hypothetical protein
MGDIARGDVPAGVLAEATAATGRLRLLATGGVHVPAAVERAAGERLGTLARQGYGMTECLVISAPAGLDAPGEPGTVGWLAPGTEARVVDPSIARDVPAGRPGELWVRGPQVMAGYHDDPEATAATLTDDGWLRTGDLVAVREDGQLVIEDRLKELIKTSTAQVAPAELELVLRTHPEVRDAAVVGRPDPRASDSGLGFEVPVAYVGRRGLVTPEELAAFVASRVAPYKRLDAVHLVDELPRTATGKLLRRTLRDRERRGDPPRDAGRFRDAGPDDGPATEPNAVVETRLLHQVHRRATTVLAEAAARPEVPDTALADLREFLVAQLRHHHESEDLDLWPQIVAAAPQTADALAELSREHDHLDATLAEVGDAPDRSRLAAAAVSLRDLVHAHLAHEEPILLPALRTHVSDESWAEFSQRVVAAAPPQGAHLMVGLLDQVGSPGEVEMVLGNMPEPARELLPALRQQAGPTLEALSA